MAGVHNYYVYNIISVGVEVFNTFCGAIMISSDLRSYQAGYGLTGLKIWKIEVFVTSSIDKKRLWIFY